MYAIAKFGSSCRAEADQHSDRDLLVVCPPHHKARLLRKYQKRNFSVSFFTERQLVRMQGKGSLFLQHLKAEAEVVIDSGGEFQRFINSCKLVKPSQTEMLRCEVALKTVLAWPNDPRTDSWKADWLYCVLRDYLVKRLAENGKLAFGISDISRSAKEQWGLTDHHFECIKNLRLNKAFFRSGSKTKKLECSVFSDVKLLFDTVVINNSPTQLEYPADLNLLDASYLNTNYQWLRALEGIYILARSEGYNHSSHEKLMKLIQQPNLYHSSSDVMQASIKSYYSDILHAVTANKAMQPIAFPLRCAALHSGG